MTSEDPQHHHDALLRGLTKAAAGLPAVSAVGGSILGAVGAGSEVLSSPCFAGVPQAEHRERVRPLFRRLGEALGCPLKVVGHWDAQALAGSRMLGDGELCSLSLDEALGAGYADGGGTTLGWLHELARCPLDINPEAPAAPSTQRGDSAMCLSLRGLPRLAQRAGVALPSELEPGSEAMHLEVLRPYYIILHSILLHYITLCYDLSLSLHVYIYIYIYI